MEAAVRGFVHLDGRAEVGRGQSLGKEFADGHEATICRQIPVEGCIANVPHEEGFSGTARVAATM